MDDPITMQCWEDLAIAVVMQAAEDYEAVCRKLEKRPDLKEALKEKRSLDRFFRSAWFHTLCSLDKETLLRMVRKERKNA